MPKKEPGMSPEEQSARFKREVERLIAAGELDPTEAEGALDAVVREAGERRQPQRGAR